MAPSTWWLRAQPCRPQQAVEGNKGRELNDRLAYSGVPLLMTKKNVVRTHIPEREKAEATRKPFPS